MQDVHQIRAPEILVKYETNRLMETCSILCALPFKDTSEIIEGCRAQIDPLIDANIKQI